MKNNIIALILSASVLVVSCDLAEQPKAKAGRDMIFGSETGLLTYTNGFYEYLPDYDNAHKQNITMDNAAKNATGTYEVGAYTTNTSTSWSWGSIRNVNYFLKYNTSSNVSEPIRNNYSGIARLFRAYLYFNKLVQYGAVPWIDIPLEPDSPELYKTQDSRDVIISKMIEDLDFAAANITEDKITPNSNRVNRWTALFFKSRVCLFEASFRKYHATGSKYGKEYLKDCKITAEELYRQAADAAQEIIEKGPYRLYTGTPYANGRGSYRELFISDNAVSQEVMLSLALDPVLQLGEANWYYNSSTYGPHLCMTHAFAKTYLNLDGTPYNDKKGDTYKTFAEETSGRDYRLNQTIRGADYTCKDKEGVFVPTPANMTGHSLTGYQFTKYVMDDISFDGGRTNYNDVPIARYAEVLLNYAEAKAELGTLTDADWEKTIGALRGRAGITGGLDKKPTTADPYMMSIYTGVTDPVILEVRREREIELILEGLRLNDLKRWACGKLWETAAWDGIYIPALNTPLDLNGDGTNDVFVTEDSKYSGPYKSIAMYTGANLKVVKLADDTKGGYRLNYEISRVWNDNMYIYPIPEIVIQKNPNLKQNPGWDK
ncbi:MAG: RagB/SusD family nutrient uptake outer membrane protein [Bacteroidales bacterium]|nr:RagB/SusD family nutrient uptake outer membrane protein [Bacteroidales bacterium]